MTSVVRASGKDQGNRNHWQNDGITRCAMVFELHAKLELKSLEYLLRSTSYHNLCIVFTTINLGNEQLSNPNQCLDNNECVGCNSCNSN